MSKEDEQGGRVTKKMRVGSRIFCFVLFCVFLGGMSILGAQGAVDYERISTFYHERNGSQGDYLPDAHTDGRAAGPWIKSRIRALASTSSRSSPSCP